MIFKDRFIAGRLLAKRLQKYKNNKNAVILAIPRGGLQIGYTLAKELNLKLDIILTKKIGHPHSPELAIGAVSLREEFVNPDFLKSGEVSQEYIDHEVKVIRKKLKESYEMYQGKEKPLSLANKVIIIVDDGVATGSTILAAIELIRKEKPKKIIVAVPVGPPGTIVLLKKNADEVVCLSTPEIFFAIGQFYENFEQVEDKEAIRLLKKSKTKERSQAKANV